jgi:hypothetical protein
VSRGGEGGAVRSLEGVLHLEGSVKATRLKLTWLPDTPDLVPLRLVDFDHLITKRKLEDDDSLADCVTPCSVRPPAAPPSLSPFLPFLLDELDALLCALCHSPPSLSHSFLLCKLP